MSRFGSEEPRGRIATTITPELVSSIEALLRAGSSREDACVTCGVSRSTVRQWKKKAAQGQQIYIDAIARFDKACLEFKRELITKLSEDADWRAAAHILARRYPEEWGKCREESPLLEAKAKIAELEKENAALKAAGPTADRPTVEVHYHASVAAPASVSTAPKP